MSDLPLAFCLLAAQIAVIGGVALVLEAWLARRCPAAAGRLLLFALVSVPVLTLAMFCPAPVSWNWLRAGQLGSQAVGETTQPPAPLADIGAEPPKGGFDAAALLRMLPRVEQRVESPRLGRVLATVWLIGFGICALRLGGGLWSVSRLRRRSRAVTDGAANEELQVLRRDMGVRHTVEVREVDLPGLPATAGWRAPMILLPPTWRKWTSAELRAALAHELAHIRSHDFLTGVVAKLLALPHAYHPLLRRVLARLRLRQELAADALGALHAGGRREYVRALARLALREPAGAGVPAPLLLSAHGGALFRRIQMLRNTERARPLSRAARGLTLAVLIGSILLAASLRGPAREPAQTPAAATPDGEPFDLGYISGDTHAIACVRPAQLFAQPGMDAYAKLMRAELTAELKKEGRQLPEGLTLADIDQVVADLQLHVQASGQKGQRAVTMGSGHFMIRMKKEVDWLKVLKALFGEVEVKTQDSHEIFLVKSPVLGPQTMPLCAVDGRTLVMVRQNKEKFIIPTKAEKTFVARIGPAWKQVEHLPFAVGLDNADGYWTNHLGPEVKDATGATDLLKAAQTLCFGVGVESGIDARASIATKDAATAKQSAAVLAVLCKSIATENAEEKSKAENDAVMKMIAEMMASGKIECVATEVRAQGHSSMKLVDLIANLDAEAKAEKK